MQQFSGINYICHDLFYILHYINISNYQQRRKTDTTKINSENQTKKLTASTIKE